MKRRLNFLFIITLIFLTVFSYYFFQSRTETLSVSPDSLRMMKQVKPNSPKTFIPALALVSGQQDHKYHLNKVNGDKYEASMASGGMHIGFDNEGIAVKRTPYSDGIEMKLSAIGYGDNVSGVSEAELNRRANLIEYKRGNLVEWYINSPFGLEQGFTISTPPSRNEAGDKLSLLIDVAGAEDVTASLYAQGKSVMWNHADWDRAIHYSSLYAYDNTGRELPSELSLRDGGITIHVDDRNAVYPIIVDPFINVAKLTDPDPDANDGSVIFGNGVAIEGDTAIVGAPFRDVDGVLSPGAAFVFERDSTGMWNFVQMLTASDAATGDEFGWDIAIVGNRALIGARQGGFFGGDAGAAYIFERDAMGVWNEVQILTASDGVLFDFFGVEVSLDGDRALVGAQDHNVGLNMSQGAAYVFERNAMGNWVEVAKLTASDGAGADSFGSGVSISGDTAIVGATGHNASRGAAYVFVRDNMGAWNETQKLTASDAMIGDAFGSELFVEGDTAVINAFLAEGASYVFERDGMGMWSETQKLTPSDANTAFAFGEVAIDGDRMIMSGGSLSSEPGSAYVFERNEMGVWEEVQIIVPGDDGGAFGLNVSISGDRIIVGAQRDTLGTEEFKGSAHIFELDSDGDGVPDDLDECSDSDLTATVVIDGCDSGVDNTLFEDGCTISDLISEIAEDAKNHGKFISGVSHFLNGLKKSGIISGSDKGAIQSCAAQSSLP